MLDAQKNKGGPLPYLWNPNVRWLEIDTTDLQTMLFEPHEDERYGLRKGDVIVCEGGEAGRAAVWDGRQAHVNSRRRCIEFDRAQILTPSISCTA